MGRIREKMEQEMVLRGSSASTQERYLCFARALVAHYRRSPEELTAEHVRRWLLYLLTEKKRKPATVNVAIGALKFMFGMLGLRSVMQDIRCVRKQYPAPSILSGSEASGRWRATDARTARLQARRACRSVISRVLTATRCGRPAS